MRNVWVLLVAVIALFVTIAMAISHNLKKKSKKPKKANFQALANTRAVRELPEYKTAKKKYHFLLFAMGLLFVTMFSSAAVLVARPVSVSFAKPEYNTRDVMLCLDVSGSMYRYIGDLSANFIEMTNRLEGQRIGVTIFDGAYMNLVPLTDDYDALAEVLEELKTDFSRYSSAIRKVQDDPSEIGPGLVGCINGFDKLDEEARMRAIILATDNYASPTQAVSILQAANYAKRYNILVYGLSIADLRPQSEIDELNAGNDKSYRTESEVFKEYREAMITTGGSYFPIGAQAHSTVGGGGPDVQTDNKYVKEIVDSILAQTAAKFDGAGTIVREDTTLVPVIILLLSSMAFCMIIWRLGV